MSLSPVVLPASPVIRRAGPLAFALCALIAIGGASVQAQEAPPATLEVPLREVGGWFFVPVLTEAGDTLDFILDTGAGVTVLSASGAARLGAEEVGTASVTGARGQTRLPLVAAPRLFLSGVEIPAARRIVLDDVTVTTDGGETVAGVVGVDFLGSFDVLIDGPARRLLLRSPVANTAWTDADLSGPITISLVSTGLITLDVELNGSRVRALLDSGARDVVVNESAAGLASLDATGPRAPLPHAGAGTGEVEGAPGSARTLGVGETILDDVAVMIANLPVFGVVERSQEAFVLLGNPFIRRCAVAISYRQRELRTCVRAGAPPATSLP